MVSIPSSSGMSSVSTKRRTMRRGTINRVLAFARTPPAIFRTMLGSFSVAVRGGALGAFVLSDTAASDGAGNARRGRPALREAQPSSDLIVRRNIGFAASLAMEHYSIIRPPPTSPGTRLSPEAWPTSRCRSPDRLKATVDVIRGGAGTLAVARLHREAGVVAAWRQPGRPLGRIDWLDVTWPQRSLATRMRMTNPLVAKRSGDRSTRSASTASSSSNSPRRSRRRWAACSR